MGHVTQLRQVLINLCTNALHALPEGRGQIEVGLCMDGPHQTRMWVADDGEGMDEAALQRIFEPYFTTKAPSHGTGLGLSLARSVAAGHGGRIEVNSVVGKGSRFTLILPLCVQTPVALGPVESHAEVPCGLGQLVLYVDDDEAMVTVVESLLSTAGFAVSSAANAAQALKLVAEWRGAVDLVITDQDMPGATGLELAQQLLREMPELPVILTSGLVNEELRLQAQTAGVRHVMQKENTLEELVYAVSTSLGMVEPV